MKLDRAIHLMAKGFEGKYDRGGAPYILHCLRVMFAMETMEEKLVAVLHDGPEDGIISYEELRKEGLSEDLISSLKKLDHSDKTVPYQTYIRNLADDPLCVKVKKADLTDNMNPTRIKGLSKKDLDRIIEYHIAYTYLSKT